MAFSDERDYDEEAANRRLMTEEAEDSYLDGTYDDQPTGGADFLPDDADSPEYAEGCRDYVEPEDDYQDYADEQADGFGNRYGWNDNEILQY